MEVDKINSNGLEPNKKEALLNELNKLKFNNTSSEQITNDMFDNIQQEESKSVVSNIDKTLETKNENIRTESKEEKNTVVEPVMSDIGNSTVIESPTSENKINDIKPEIKPEEPKPMIEQPIEEENTKIENKKEPMGVSYFDGKLLDLMGWNFLRIVLTIFTFGMGATWGECLYLKYKLSHTVINGKRLKFEGDGSELFVEQFKWTFLTMITFGIYALWIPVKKISWVISKICFEEDFDKSKTFFCGSMLRLLGVNIICGLLTVISFGILFPVTECIKLRWLSKNTVINNKSIHFKGKSLGLYGNYIKWFFLTMITLGIYSLWIPVKKISWEVENTEFINI